MSWFSFVFPNTALVTATMALGKSFKNKGFCVSATVLGVILVGVWAAVFAGVWRAIWTKRILWPQEEKTAVDQTEGKPHSENLENTSGVDGRASNANG